MITVEDSKTDNERFYINPSQVAYIKERKHESKIVYRILLSNGESVVTQDGLAIQRIINSIQESHYEKVI